MKKILFCLLAFSVVSCSSNDLFIYEDYQTPTYTRKYRKYNNSSNSYLEFHRGKNHNSATIVIDGIKINLIKDKYSDDEKYLSYDSKYEITLKDDYLYVNNEGNYTEYYGFDEDKKTYSYNDVLEAYDRVESKFVNPKNDKNALLITAPSVDHAILNYDGDLIDLFRVPSASGISYKTRNGKLRVSVSKKRLYLEHSNGRVEELIDADQYFSFVYNPTKYRVGKNSSKFSIYDSPITTSKDKVVYNFRSKYGDSRVMMITSPSLDVAVVRKDGKEFELYKIQGASGLSYESPDKKVIYSISKGNLYIEKGNYTETYYDNYTYNINYAK